ncbi:tripartite tricarboxylate transporter TctB [Amylibacter ulvae]|uniref:Tripartite tricarboxylate transporter TctB n=1 Tax=Paramylibacter ulvae TaxID=1651968 RepID=A0ABQ3D8D0_9RHOB|nr:tripartite tricarboxylate transporter TctB family protein [Amylibacter ulvae]GHA62849.1 tripartite tricarboxylate transporter TctB [Amylibacter ulvae]
MKINDRIIGGLTILGGLGVIAGTLEFREIPGQLFGSAFFPRILGVALILTGFVQTVTGANGALFQVNEILKGRSGLQVLAALAAIVIWVIISPALGFILTTACLIAALAMLAEGRLWPSIATGVVMSFILFFVFGKLLRVPLPYGLIESVLT